MKLVVGWCKQPQPEDEGGGRMQGGGCGAGSAADGGAPQLQRLVAGQGTAVSGGQQAASDHGYYTVLPHCAPLQHAVPSAASASLQAHLCLSSLPHFM